MQKILNFSTLLLIALFLSGSKITDTPKPWVFNPVLPSEITVFGERVPLEDPEVRERVENEIILMSRQEHLMLRYFKRSGKWFKKFDEILTREGVPTDFKYLAVVESGLDNLVSSAKAAGFWQFLDETGRQFGLKINQEIDERYDPEKSAMAAVRYLKMAKGKFGTWAAAAGSYNCGMGGMETRIASQKTRGYYDLLLPDETMKYVPRIAAMKLIFEDPAKYGYIVNENDYWKPNAGREIQITETISDLAAYAVQNGTTYKTLRYLNPWIRGTKLTAAKGSPVTIKLP
ncbi:MAG: lytic transglycosylase domain-containing protein [Bacteroidetes bacterium]|nr:lytic transglycosylase domain-containing protein [Bacteroidota bacterium]